MLRGIPSIISPELLKVLMEMGHGDEICIGDGNFPHMSTNNRVIRCDGHQIVPLLEAVLALMPLDTAVDKPVTLMAVTPGDPVKTPIWDEFRRALAEADPRGDETIAMLDRFAFYERAKTCYAVVATGEPALYANIILKKGVLAVESPYEKKPGKIVVDFREE